MKWVLPKNLRLFICFTLKIIILSFFISLTQFQTIALANNIIYGYGDYVLGICLITTYLPSIFEWLYIKHFIGHSRLNRTRQIVTDLDRWQTFMTLKISGIFDVFLMVSNSMRSFPPHKDSRRREANSFNFYRQHNHIIWISQFCPHILLWIIFQEFRKTEMKNI